MPPPVSVRVAVVFVSRSPDGHGWVTTRTTAPLARGRHFRCVCPAWHLLWPRARHQAGTTGRGDPEGDGRMQARGRRRGTTLSLSGALCAAAVAKARPILHDAVDQGSGDLVLDLSRLEMIDAAGLGVLVGTSACGPDRSAARAAWR